MGYIYATDGHPGVVSGAGGLTYGRVIQRDDGLGGYNTSFFPAGRPGEQFHIHFGHNGCAIRVIRYFPVGAGQGENIVNYNKSPTKNAGGLLHEIKDSDYYPNYKLLLGHLKTLITGLPKLPNNELA